MASATTCLSSSSCSNRIFNILEEVGAEVEVSVLGHLLLILNFEISMWTQEQGYGLTHS